MVFGSNLIDFIYISALAKLTLQMAFFVFVSRQDKFYIRFRFTVG